MCVGTWRGNRWGFGGGDPAPGGIEWEVIVKNRKSFLMKIHKHIVCEILEKMDIPFAEYRTHYFCNGDIFIYHGKKTKVVLPPDEMLISSYVEFNGLLIRISNHEKAKENFEGINIVYNKDTGKYNYKKIKPL